MFENEKCRFVTNEDYLANKEEFDKYLNSNFGEYAHWNGKGQKQANSNKCKFAVEIYKGMSDPMKIYYFLTKSPQTAEEWAEILLADDWSYYLSFHGGCFGYNGGLENFIDKICHGDIEDYVKRIMKKLNFIKTGVEDNGERWWSNGKAPTGDYGKEIRKLVAKGLKPKVILKKCRLTGVSEIKENIF